MDVKPPQGGWSKRTKLEKALIIAACLLFIGCLLFVIGSICLLIERAKNDSKTCMTPHCISTAARIIEAMDSSVDPCDNFFEFACGSWIRNNPIPDDRPNVNTFKKLDDDLLHNLKAILESAINENTPVFERNVKNFYLSCKDMNTINSQGSNALLEYIKEFGGWPLLHDNWNESQFDLNEVMAKLKFMTPNNILFKMYVNANDKDSDAYILQMDQITLIFPKSFYVESQYAKVLRALRDYISNIAEAMSEEASNKTRLSLEVDRIISFESKLANITIAEEKRRMYDESVNLIRSVENVSSIFGETFDFKGYVTTIYERLNISVLNNESIVLHAPSYIEGLAALLKETPKRDIANYVFWQTIAFHVPGLPQKFQDMRQQFNRISAGTSQERPRWMHCVSQTNEHFGMMVGSLYVKKHFNPKAKENALQLIKGLKKAFLNNIDEVSWMTEKTKAVAKEKVLHIRENIGYPDFLLNDTAFGDDDLYISNTTLKSTKQSSMQPHKYLDNIMRLYYYQNANNLVQLRKRVDKNKWMAHPGQVNAFYSPNRNQITFPAAILQSPFYHEDNPMYLNFGGIGVVIGHEVTHGFDDRGRQYDKDGNVKEWWSEEDRERFIDQTKCIIEQYSNYKIDEINQTLNGIITQGENIADNGGLRQAFHAYQHWVSQNGQEKRLPGLPYNSNQMFFINFGQVWCGSMRPEHAIYVAKQSKHSPGKLRVWGTLVNLQEFSDVYKCPIGSEMNPEKKCRVW